MSKRIDRQETNAATAFSPASYTQPATTNTHVNKESTVSTDPRNKRRAPDTVLTVTKLAMSGLSGASPSSVAGEEPSMTATSDMAPPPAKKSRTNTPWTAAEEQRLKSMRDVGNTWAEIAKTFPTRTEGSVKKHWYKDMHYAEFAEDESQALLNAIKEYETNKWKVIGAKVGKPAKACEQYAKEHFAGRI